ncbi:MAG: UxaA family hydrolase [Pedobacter sp.]|nr:UxaA family hydrolase [Pedobacter sp.]
MADTFEGYYRADGSVGTANYWIVVPLVFCENNNVEKLRDALQNTLGYGRLNPYEEFLQSISSAYVKGEDFTATIPAQDATEDSQGIFPFRKRVFPNVDGIKFYTHTMGCGGTRQDSDLFCALVAGYITNPNVAGATILSLGCQNAQSEILITELSRRVEQLKKPVYILDQQALGVEEVMITQAIKGILAGLAVANAIKRKTAPLNKLCIGFSGQRTNDFFLAVTELVLNAGGSVVLPKFPGITANRHLSSFKTDEAVQLPYPEKINQNGFHLINTAEGAIESITAQTAAGVNLVISCDENTELSEHAIAPVFCFQKHLNYNSPVKNCNDLISTEEQLQKLLDYASGRIAKTPDNPLQEDFRPWKQGISL